MLYEAEKRVNDSLNPKMNPYEGRYYDRKKWLRKLRLWKYD